MRIYPLFVLLLTLLSWQCQPAAPADDEAAETTTEQPAATVQGTVEYPSIPASTMRYLADSCDYIDFIFYRANFSMSQSEGGAIRNTLAGVSTQPPVINPNCQATGRIFFQVQGINAVEADFFIENGCAYYIFLEDGQYKYANLMTQQGFGVYQNIINQARSAPQPQ
ncbi:MAG: hypothetical protein KDC54_24695 [Lewinella sp.]|nr:hypothetical protein [Lewinella sp.]